MDGNRFDDLSRRLAGGISRRSALKAVGAGLLAAAGFGARTADAQVSQAQCGNKLCKNDPGVCDDACVCCVFSNGNSRCRPADKCGGGEIVCPPGEQFCANLNRCAVCCVDADCPAEDACTIPVCSGGTCIGTVNFCNDNNVCTADACDPVTGCSNTPLSDTPCGANGDQICCNGTCCADGAFCDATIGCIECRSDDDCPASTAPCQRTTCASGFCVSAATDEGVQCATGKVCVDGTCVGNGLCDPSVPTGCGNFVPCDDGSCGFEESGCVATVEGAVVCGAFFDVVTPECDTSADCADGQICTPTCIGTRCAAVCGG